MDPQVQDSQRWLNSTYGGASGWVRVDEDGVTGWATIYALRRALQAELGLSPVQSGFGTETTSAFTAEIGRIDGGTTSQNLLRILSACLWCKGYPGVSIGTTVTFAALSTSVGRVRGDLGLGTANPFVDVKLMASLMSMDAYTLLGSGSSYVREVQQWLNSRYAHRTDFVLSPCDGICTRQVQTALLFALQYEIGMADGTANGNFGPGTQDGLRSRAPVGPGSTDGSATFVRLYQAALRFNTYGSPFSGTFDEYTEQDTRAFQSFMELPVTGRGDYSTWCALLVSCGDTSIATKGFDTRFQLTAVEARNAVGAGFTTVGRYLVGAGKFITATELDGLREAGLRLLPIHQRLNNTAEVMTAANGRVHGIEAIERARVLGLPSGSLLFFCVDFDAQDETVRGPICDYFRAVRNTMDTTLTVEYRVGVYGTRNVCATVIDEGLAEAAFVAGMSKGYSGNMGFTMPKQWHVNQIVEVPGTQAFGGGRAIDIDKDVISSRARPVELGSVVSPPVERDLLPSATGFDSFFEWLVRAEVACERGLESASSLLVPLAPYAVFTSSYIAHWLQKPEYWDDGDGGKWSTYTPVLDPSTNEKLARAAAEEELAALLPAKPVSSRDIAHFAATLRGYEVWGVPTHPDGYGLGDLGGWALDLLSVWGAYLRARDKDSDLDLTDYFTAQIGSTDGTAGFGWKDLVADADAYLVSAAMKRDGTSMSGALRGLLQQTEAQRIRTFYEDRFGGSQENLGTAFATLVNGIDVNGTIENLPWTRAVLVDAAGMSASDSLPDPGQAFECGYAYARAMTSPR
jgi:peptidoglycan hydrolase-like protein with peptidoglycan-binding domain